MVLNYIWIAFFLIAFAVATGRLLIGGDTAVFTDIINATFASAKTGFEISIGLTGILSLWLGIMKIGEKGGMIQAFARLAARYQPQGEELDRVVTARRKERIRALDERVVKCRLIASEEHSMVSFEDFQIYCQENGKNVFEETLALDRLHYLEMQIADYILNNIDRHGANWGFFMDNETGRLEKLYPLMDHDQAFSDVEGMRSQTTEQNLDLETAALLAQTELHADLGRILQMAQPEGISEKQWAQVQRRAAELDERCRIYESEL